MNTSGKKVFHFLSYKFLCVLGPSSCGSPDKKLNTTIEDKNYTIGAEIKYKCPLGHMLVGDSKRVCQEDGFWSGMSPSCKCK